MSRQLIALASVVAKAGNLKNKVGFCTKKIFITLFPDRTVCFVKILFKLKVIEFVHKKKWLYAI